MKPLRTAVLVLAIAATATGASAQGNPSPGTGPMGSMPMHHPMGGMMGHQPGQQAATPHGTRSGRLRRDPRNRRKTASRSAN